MKLATVNRRHVLRNGVLVTAAALARPQLAPVLELSAVTAQNDSAAKTSVRIIVVDSLSDALRIHDQLKKGADFATMASKISIDPSAKQGGSLGKIEPSALRPELREAIKNMGPGEISPVLKTAEGYAIVMVDRQDHSLAMGEYPVSLLALTGPGAIQYGPNVDGAGEVYALFTYSSQKPKDFNLILKPITAAQYHHQSLDSGIRMTQQMLNEHSDDTSPAEAVQTRFLLAQLFAFQGEMAPAIEQWGYCYTLAETFDSQLTQYIEEVLAIAHLHKSEMENGVYDAPGDRCLFPMSPDLCYAKKEDSEKASEHLLNFLHRNPDDLEAKWLLNLTEMTLGNYPGSIPKQHLLPLSRFESKQDVGRFIDVASEVGITGTSDGGGIIVDDFENRGLFDLVISDYETLTPRTLRYFRNNGDGTFTERTEGSGLEGQLCGLNMIQADYDNDGCLDILLLRGAWVYPQPLTLFRGNGDGTFRDVTVEAGLGALVATQAGVWADINNDGLLDLFIGNEKGPSSLFLNKGDGTFEDISVDSGVNRIAYTKGVVAADFDNDGYVDFYVSNFGSGNFLYQNQRNNTFKEIAREAGVDDPLGRSFATWFFDYDNDGWPDLFVTSNYSSVDETMRTYLGLSLNAITLKLYRNKRDGTFEDVTEAAELNKVFMPMGANFGDVDNDGFLDIYLGTGNPSYGSLVPNVLLRNDGARRFVDITASSGTGELHKGHGIAFADMNNSGHQDLLTVIGGATPGDKHAFRFFKNPGSSNDWIRIKLVGVKSNRSAIDARIKVAVENRGRGRSFVQRTVSSGGSFGANPLEQHFGLGPKARIEEVEVWWPATKTRQRFSKVAVNQCIEIKEFATNYEVKNRPTFPLGGAMKS